jgi:uncharacterized RmlC-like cupin family protein
MMKHHGLKKFDKIYVQRSTGGSRVWYGLKLREEYEFNAAGFIRERENF